MRRLILFVFILTACAGARARNTAFGPIKQSLPHITIEIKRGLADGEEDGEPAVVIKHGKAHLVMLRAAVRDEDRSAVARIDRVALQAWAYRGIADMIDDEEIDSRLAPSFQVEVDLFFDLLRKIR